MKPISPSARLCAVLLWQLTACVLACGHDEKETGRVEPLPAPAPLEQAPAHVELPPLPARGEVTLEPSGDTLTLLANQAPRGRVLRKLKQLRDFELILAEPKAARGAVTLRLAGVSVEDAIVSTLSGVSFSLHYAVADMLSLVDRVTIGDAGVEAGATAATAKDLRRAKRKELRRKLARSREEKANEQAAPSEEERSRQREEAAAELERGLTSPDARTRAAAVETLDEENVPELLDHLGNDRSPDVRAAAAQALGALAATRANTSALVAALGDPDPQVVMAALDSLQWLDDPSVIPDVKGVLDHPDSDVRALAAETVDWLD